MVEKDKNTPLRDGSWIKRGLKQVQKDIRRWPPHLKVPPTPLKK